MNLELAHRHAAYCIIFHLPPGAFNVDGLGVRCKSLRVDGIDVQHLKGLDIRVDTVRLDETL